MRVAEDRPATRHAKGRSTRPVNATGGRNRGSGYQAIMEMVLWNPPGETQILWHWVHELFHFANAPNRRNDTVPDSDTEHSQFFREFRVFIDRQPDVLRDLEMLRMIWA